MELLTILLDSNAGLAGIGAGIAAVGAGIGIGIHAAASALAGKKEHGGEE